MTETMQIHELFAADVTRDIPPVVYFYEQRAEKLADEVREYIVTGGYPESDVRHQRVGGALDPLPRGGLVARPLRVPPRARARVARAER